jgi:hypothetical protein
VCARVISLTMRFVTSTDPNLGLGGLSAEMRDRRSMPARVKFHFRLQKGQTGSGGQSSIKSDRNETLLLGNEATGVEADIYCR